MKEVFMKKNLILVLLAVLIALTFIACGGDDEDAADDTADAATRPTEMTATDTDDLQEALGPDGAWIILFEDDVVATEEITISGEVYEEEGAEAPRRKLALYTQDADRNVTDRFTLTVPRLIVEHENTLIQAGEVAGNVYVNADGFELRSAATINGNLYFATEAQRESADISDDSQVLGEIAVRAPADAVTHPTELTATTAENLQEALGPEGSWIVLFEEDITADETIMVFGAVYEEEGAEAPRRKLALYTQDEDRNVTARYTLTVPSLAVHHMNTRIQAGTISGDVYVSAEGFELIGGATIDGDLYFATEELRDSAEISDDSTVTGEIKIGSRT